MVKGWVVCPCMLKTLGSLSSGVTLLEVLVHGDVNMTSVDFVEETKDSVSLPLLLHILTMLGCQRLTHQGIYPVLVLGVSSIFYGWLMMFHEPVWFSLALLGAYNIWKINNVGKENKRSYDGALGHCQRDIHLGGMHSFMQRPVHPSFGRVKTIVDG